MEYVDKPDSVLHKKLFGGDQLTAACVRGAQLAMSNNKTAMKQLEGAIPVIEDWHTKANFLGVSYNKLQLCIIYTLYYNMQVMLLDVNMK